MMQLLLLAYHEVPADTISFNGDGWFGFHTAFG